MKATFTVVNRITENKYPRKSIGLYSIYRKLDLFVVTCSRESTDSRKEGNRGHGKKNPVQLWRVPEVSLNSSGHDARILSYVWRPYFFYRDSASRLTEFRTLVRRQIIIVHCALHCARSVSPTRATAMSITWFSLGRLHEKLQGNFRNKKGRIKLSLRFSARDSGRLSCATPREDSASRVPDLDFVAFSSSSDVVHVQQTQPILFHCSESIIIPNARKVKEKEKEEPGTKSYLPLH